MLRLFREEKDMNFIKPKDENSFLIVCERCGAIINFSKEDCYCTKEAEGKEFREGNIQNITRVYIRCPNCMKPQDVAAGFRYVKDDKCWF